MQENLEVAASGTSDGKTAADTDEHGREDLPINRLAFLADLATSSAAPQSSYPSDVSTLPLGAVNQVEDMISRSQHALEYWLRTSVIPSVTTNLSTHFGGFFEGYGLKQTKQLTQDITKEVLATIASNAERRLYDTTTSVSGTRTSSKRRRKDPDGEKSCGVDVKSVILQLQ